MNSQKIEKIAKIYTIIFLVISISVILFNITKFKYNL